jgi:hypothetical protein
MECGDAGGSKAAGESAKLLAQASLVIVLLCFMFIHCSFLVCLVDGGMLEDQSSSMRREAQLILRRNKHPIYAVTRTGAVSRDDTKMIRGARTQAADVRTDTLVSVPRLALGGSCGPVASRGSVLKMHGGGQSVRIDRAVECR